MSPGPALTARPPVAHVAHLLAQVVAMASGGRTVRSREISDLAANRLGYPAPMFLILAILLLAVLFGAVGFAVHLLWIVAAIVLVLWVVGFLARSGSGRWYRW
jgi:hypothetical protein